MSAREGKYLREVLSRILSERPMPDSFQTFRRLQRTGLKMSLASLLDDLGPSLCFLEILLSFRPSLAVLKSRVIVMV